MALSLTTGVLRKPGLIFTDMDGDVVAVNVERGEYYGIGGIGARVWDLLENSVTIERIVDTICDEYEVDEETCRSDMLTFVNELMEYDLIVTADAGPI